MRCAYPYMVCEAIEQYATKALRIKAASDICIHDHLRWCIIAPKRIGALVQIFGTNQAHQRNCSILIFKDILKLRAYPVHSANKSNALKYRINTVLQGVFSLWCYTKPNLPTGAFVGPIYSGQDSKPAGQAKAARTALGLTLGGLRIVDRHNIDVAPGYHGSTVIDEDVARALTVGHGHWREQPRHSLRR